MHQKWNVSKYIYLDTVLMYKFEMFLLAEVLLKIKILQIKQMAIL